nr:unnamed protein product [Spirometra erinaceieuropaei]
MIGPPVGTRNRLCHQHLPLVSPPDKDIVQQVPLTRPRIHPGGLLSHRRAEEGILQDESVFCADTRVSADAGVEVTKNNEFFRLQHGRQECVQVLVESVPCSVETGHRQTVAADDAGEFAYTEREVEAQQEIVDAMRHTDTWRVCRYDTLTLISKTGGGRNITFADMAQVNDTDWKRPFNPDVFLLYPQGFALREILRNYRETGLGPEPPVNSPSMRFLKVSTSVCPPELDDVADRKHNIDLVVIVKSAVYNFDDRQAFRRFYAHLRKENSVNPPYRIGVVFVVGLPTSAISNSFRRDGFNISLPGRAGNSPVNIANRRTQIQMRLEQEMREHDDLIVGDFEDTY